MKTLIFICIRIYQTFLSPLRALFPYGGCRFYPTCSQYMMQAVSEQGVARGLRLGLARVLRCNPWNF